MQLCMYGGEKSGREDTRKVTIVIMSNRTLVYGKRKPDAVLNLPYQASLRLIILKVSCHQALAFLFAETEPTGVSRLPIEDFNAAS